MSWPHFANFGWLLQLSCSARRPGCVKFAEAADKPEWLLLQVSWPELPRLGLLKYVVAVGEDDQYFLHVVLPADRPEYVKYAVTPVAAEHLRFVAATWGSGHG